MKLQPDTAEGVNLINRQEPERVWVAGRVHASSVLVPWAGEVTAWPAAALADLTHAHFEQILALRPELVILGSGPVLRFVPAQLLRPLIERRIGVETMDTPAACRTYNVLASEGRAVVAALLLSGTR
jgi:uncharacterized protein